MSTAAVGHCVSCSAVVNMHWSHCVVCHLILPTSVPAPQLLATAPGKGQEVAKGWLIAWRELATLTYGITKEDPRFVGVMAALNQCDEAYLGGQWVAFRHAAEQVRRAMAGGQTHEQA